MNSNSHRNINNNNNFNINNNNNFNNNNNNINNNFITNNNNNKSEIKKLNHEIIDLKNTIYINWKIFSDFVKSKNIETEENKSKNENIIQLLKDCKNLIDDNIKIDKEITKLKEENYLISENCENYKKNLENDYNNQKKKIQ